VKTHLEFTAGVALLQAHFDAHQRLPTFLRADPFPPLGDSGVTDLVLDALLHESRDSGARERASR
jgi:hypothetical protein